MTTENSMVKELKRITSNQLSDIPVDQISLYDLFSILKKKKKEFEQRKETQDLLLYMVMYKDYKFFFESVNFKIEEISFKATHIGIGKMNQEDGHLYYSKKTGELVIVEENPTSKIKVQDPILKACVPHYYEFMLKNKNYLVGSYTTHFLPSNLKVSITREYIKLFDDKYVIIWNISSNQYECNFNPQLIEELQSKDYHSADRLLKRIYIPIKGCPEWCMGEINELKNTQIESDKKYTKK